MGLEWVTTLDIWKSWNKTTDQCCWESCGTLEGKVHRPWNTQFIFKFYFFLKETRIWLFSVSITTYALWIYNIIDQYWEFLNTIIYSSRYQLSWSEFIFVSLLLCKIVLGFPGGSNGEESACSAGDPGSIPGSGRSPGEGNGNPLQYSESSIPWTEEPGRLHSMGLQRVGHDWAINTQVPFLYLLFLHKFTVLLLRFYYGPKLWPLSVAHHWVFPYAYSDAHINKLLIVSLLLISFDYLICSTPVNKPNMGTGKVLFFLSCISFPSFVSLVLNKVIIITISLLTFQPRTGTPASRVGTWFLNGPG